MLDRKKETRRLLKTEKITYSCISLMLACLLFSNLLNLSRRKKHAQAELSRIFTQGYVEKIITGMSQIPQRDFESIPYVLHTNPFDNTDNYELVETPEGSSTEESTKESPTQILQKFIRKTINSKLRNPFLFGFKDVAEDVFDFLKLHTFCNKKLRSNISSVEVHKNFEKYFQGSMSSEYYMLMCRIITQILISDQNVQSRTGLIIKEGDDTYLNRNEYLAVAACLGEITTVLLGHRIESKAFADDLGLSQSNLEASAIGQVLQLGTPDSAMHPITTP